jgi:hypothetical protein
MVLWAALVLMTAFVPGVGIGRWAKMRHWAAPRVRRTSLVIALAFYLASGVMAQYHFGLLPFAWAFQPWPFLWLVAGGFWFSAALSAPLIAQRIAGLPSSERRLW